MSHLEESAFGLTADELEQIKYLEVLKRRRKNASTSQRTRKSFAETLSIEAQIAMQLAMEDTKAETAKNETCESAGSMESGYSKSDSISTNGSSSEFCGSPMNVRCERHLDRQTSARSFSELYRRNNSARMSRDITDVDYSAQKEKKQALGGGKVESAMEIIEIIQHGDEGVVVDFNEVDDEAISELARINSVEKCEVWMQATDEVESDDDVGPVHV